MASEMQPVKTWGFDSVKELRDLKVPISEIARQFGKSRQAVYDLLNKEGGLSTTESPQNVNPATAQGYEATSFKSTSVATTQHQGGV